MALRAALPDAATTITPGYSWRLDLDILFNGERPDDWPLWTVRMHVWSDCLRFSLTPGEGVTFEEVEGLAGASTPQVIPVVEMTEAQTLALRGERSIHYVIDLAPPDGDAEDYFAGSIKTVFSPPAELLR